MFARTLALTLLSELALAQANVPPTGVAAESQDTPAQLYVKHCGDCHNGRLKRAPDKWFLQMMPFDLLLAAMETGVMRQQAEVLTPVQRTQVTEYLAGYVVPPAPKLPPACTGKAGKFDYSVRPIATGRGMDFENRRYIAPEVAGLPLRQPAAVTARCESSP